MFGLSLSFLIGYAVGRWFGDFIKETIRRAYNEIHEWL